MWAVLAWLNVLAATQLSVRDIAERHWRRFGRHYYARHDYDELPASSATQVMQALASSLLDLPGKRFGDYTVTEADEFNYRDPVDGSIATNQGLRVTFGDEARLVVRLSGTGTKGATLRLYLERYQRQETTLGWKTAEALAPLANLAEKLVRVAEITGRRAPNVIT